MDDRQRDHLVRLAAFEFLDSLDGRHDGVLPWSELLAGFTFDGARVPLISQQGIFKPAVLGRDAAPLSIRTTPPKPGKPPPYADEFGADGFLRYRYRGTDILHRDNVGLRRAHERQIPLVYFHGVEPGWYIAAYPVFVVHDDPQRLTFSVAVDAADVTRDVPYSQPREVAEERRRYVTRQATVRLHQRSFRHRVLGAYQRACSVCRLRHPELLDAAHIIPDGEERGEPVVPNGLSLCKIHHAAFDHRVLGIRPDLVVEIRPDILEEVDGPMLRHGLQDLHGTRLTVPRRRADRPDEARLDVRYQRFRHTG